MKVKEAASNAILQLSSIYSNREATQIIAILFEDLFEVSNIESERAFEYEEELVSALERLKNSEPIQYVTGVADFFGLKFKVNQHTLIPRPETEELVAWILSDLKQSKKQLDLVDVGLGSGCIALTLAKKHRFLRVFGIEYSLDALNVARINSRLLQAPMTFYCDDILDDSSWDAYGRFDVIVSNPPYIDQEDRRVMADNVLLYEPEMALFAGDDKFVFYKSLERFAQSHLKDGGVVYLEIHEAFALETKAIFQKEDRAIEIRKDMQGKDRMMKISYP